MPEPWYRIESKEPGHIAIAILDVISSEGEDSFFRQLRDLLPAKRIDLHLNSWGGDVFCGMAIYNKLSHLASAGVKIKARVEGVAGSIASVIAMAAQEIAIGEGGFMVVHAPKALSEGAEGLETTFSDAFVRIYGKKTGRTAGEIKTLMERGTWMNGREAVWEKFADTITC